MCLATQASTKLPVVLYIHVDPVSLSAGKTVGAQCLSFIRSEIPIHKLSSRKPETKIKSLEVIHMHVHTHTHTHTQHTHTHTYTHTAGPCRKGDRNS